MPHHALRGHRSQPKSCLCFRGRLSTCQGFPPAPAVGAQPWGRGFASRGQHSVALYHTWAVGAKGRAGHPRPCCSAQPHSQPAGAANPPSPPNPLAPCGCRTGSLCPSSHLPTSCRQVLGTSRPIAHGAGQGPERSDCGLWHAGPHLHGGDPGGRAVPRGALGRSHGVQHQPRTPRAGRSF